jgi:hypothetical protein
LSFDTYQQLGMTRPNERATISSLPIGNFQAPTDGWLAVSGRRGHYEFCDGVAAFDLQTGGAFKSDSCSGLQLRSDGSVDFGATDRKRQRRPVRGTASADNLRELVWMLLMKDSVQSRKRGESFPIPNTYTRRFKVIPTDGGSSGGSFGMSTAQTLLAWTWIAPNGQVRANGNLTWPPWFWGPDLAESHAASLLSVMEGSVTPGCPTPPAPAVEGALLKGMGRDALLENLIESAPSEEAKAAMREMIKLRAAAGSKEPVDPAVDATSNRHSLESLFRKPCKQ